MLRESGGVWSPSFLLQSLKRRRVQFSKIHHGAAFPGIGVGMTPAQKKKKESATLSLEITFDPCRPGAWTASGSTIRVHLRHDPDWTTPDHTNPRQSVRIRCLDCLVLPSPQHPNPVKSSLIMKAGRGEPPNLFSSWLSVMDVRVYHPGHPSPWPPTSADRRSGC